MTAPTPDGKTPEASPTAPPVSGPLGVPAPGSGGPVPGSGPGSGGVPASGSVGVPAPGPVPGHGGDTGPAWADPGYPQATASAGAGRGRPSRRELLLCLAVLAGAALLGGPIGLIWAAVAPRVEVQKTGDGSAVVVSDLERFVAAEGWFLFLTVGYAFVLTLVVWLTLRRHRGPAMLVALSLGTIAASVLAWWIGSRLGLSHYRDLLRAAPAGRTLERPPDLRALRTTLLAGGLASAITSVLLAGFAASPDLQPVHAGAGSPDRQPSGDHSWQRPGDMAWHPPGETPRQRPADQAQPTPADQAWQRPADPVRPPSGDPAG